MRVMPMVIVAAAVSVAACGLLREGPRDVADAFWAASQAGDADAARALVASGGSARINDPDEGGTGITGYEVGDAVVEGDEASVPTTLRVGDGEREVRFETMLVLEDDAWRVDLDRTTDEMTRAMLGTTIRELGEAMGEAVGEVMEGVAEGMQAAGESLSAAAERMRRER